MSPKRTDDVILDVLSYAARDGVVISALKIDRGRFNDLCNTLAPKESCVDEITLMGPFGPCIITPNGN